MLNNSQIARVASFRSVIQTVLEQPSMLEFCRSCTLLISKFHYFNRLLRLPFSKPLQLQEQIMGCLQVFSTIITYLSEGSQIQTKSRSMIRKFNMVIGYNSNFPTRRQHCSQAILTDSYCHHLVHKSNQTIPTYNPQFLNSYMKDISEGTINIQDNQCIGCTRILISGRPIVNENPIFPVFTNLQYFDNFLFQKYVVAVCNAGGGVLVVGGDNWQPWTLPKGMHFSHLNLNQIDKIQRGIIEAFQSIVPTCNFTISKFFIVNHQGICKPPSNSYNRICFRVVVTPHESKRITYIDLTKKGCVPVYHSYFFFSKNNVDNSMDQKIYKTIHKNYKQKAKTLKSSHQHIRCYQPSPFIQPHSDLDENAAKMEGVAREEEVQMKEGFDDLKDGFSDLKFKYVNSSLIIVGSAKQNKNVALLNQKLQLLKQSFEISKPFEKEVRLQGGREIWMFSHQENLIKLRKAVANQPYFKEKKLVIISVEKILRVNKALLSQYKQNKIQEKFYQYYGRVPELISQKQTDEGGEWLYFTTNNLSEAVFTFLIFEEIGVRAHFCKSYKPQF